MIPFLFAPVWYLGNLPFQFKGWDLLSTKISSRMPFTSVMNGHHQNYQQSVFVAEMFFGSCAFMALSTIWYNDIHNFAVTLSCVCHDVTIDPNFQPLSGELLQCCIDNILDEAHLDLKAGSFCDTGFKVHCWCNNLLVKYLSHLSIIHVMSTFLMLEWLMIGIILQAICSFIK